MKQPPVVILCGGSGTRLKEETEFRPKPMVRVGNRPILWHIMRIYSCYGFNRFILCLGYKGEMIKEFFYHYQFMNNDFTIALGGDRNLTLHDTNDECNWTVTLCNTGHNALKGARLKRIEKYVDNENFLMTYGDGVADINIKALYEFHRSHGKTATITGVRPKFLRFGELIEEENQAIHFSEKPEYRGNLINGGFFVFNREIFNYLTDEDACELEGLPLDELTRKGELMVYEHDGFWACMDTIRDAEFLNELWKNNQAEWKIW